MAKAFSKTKPDERICTICQDIIENSSEAEVTSCNHVFHALCGHENRKSQFKHSMLELRLKVEHELLSDDDLKLHIAKQFFEFETGRSCPNCRQKHPFAYRLAKKTTFKDSVYKFPKLSVSFAAEDVLRIVSR